MQVAPDLAALSAVEQRVLWLATAMVHHANRVRRNDTGVKVGGHQASSASVVSIMTTLWFGGVLRARRGVGQAARSYPSRVKDPDPVDYSTGSVGIGATATIWGALAHRYLAGHFEAAIRDLGGHDHAALLEAYDRGRSPPRSVVLAYTIKGWGLPIAGHPGNHSALLNDEQLGELASALGQSILVGTPSGVALAPEGGAHQSIVTPGIGIEQPGCVAWEPAFGQDFEWAFLAALGQLGRSDGSSAYFRLTSPPIDQALAELPEDDAARAERRRQALAGGYVLSRADGQRRDVALVGVGAAIPETLQAAQALRDEAGVAADVVCLTSPDLCYRALRASQGLGEGDAWILEALFPSAAPAPLVTVQDGRPHALGFLAAVNGVPVAGLGVESFGQSGTLDELFRHHGIDVETIVGAALDLLG